MKPAIHLSVAGLWRRPGRTALRIGVITIAVGLLAGMILFIGNSLRTASATALRQVPLDLQGPVTSYPKDLQVAGGVAKQPGVVLLGRRCDSPVRLGGAQRRGTHHPDREWRCPRRPA